MLIIKTLKITKVISVMDVTQWQQAFNLIRDLQQGKTRKKGNMPDVANLQGLYYVFIPGSTLIISGKPRYCWKMSF